MIHMQESFSGVRVVQAFAREQHNAEQFNQINEMNYDANVNTVKISAFYIPFVEWLGGFGIALVLYFGGRGVIDDDVSLGTVVAFIFYLDFIFQPIQRLSQTYDLVQAATAALNKVFGLLSEQPDVKESPNAQALSQPVHGELTFDHVSFAYGETPVLEDINLRIEAGQRVAVVGATGAGKSTLAKLVMRFYDPRAGSGAAGRHRPSRRSLARPAAHDRDGAAGRLPVQRDDPRQHPLRPTQRDRRTRCERPAASWASIRSSNRCPRPTTPW